MIGILLQAIATFFEEVSGSLGKWMVERREESYFALGFQNTILSVVFFVCLIAFDPSRWRLDPRSFPTLAILIVIACIQGWAAMKATIVAERSSFNFIRTGTIPLLLAVDLLLGYVLKPMQVAGILLILIALAALFVNHGVEKKGALLVGWTAIGSVATISLYKWHITHYNSVEAEQIILHAALLIMYFWGARRYFKENPLKLLARPHALAQSGAYALGSILESFAYLYGPASIILAAKRSFAVLWGIAAGNRVFHEKHPALRVAVGGAIVIGIVLLVA